MAMHLGDAGAQLLVGFFQKRRQGSCSLVVKEGDQMNKLDET